MTKVDLSSGQLQLLPEPPTTPTDVAVRVVVACSKWKVTSSQLASRQELDERRTETEQRLRAHAMPARDLYLGRAYRRAVASVDAFARRRPDLPVALHIASAGYGIVEAHQELVPYEAVMGTGVRQWRARGEFLGMPQQARSLVETCSLTVFALSQPYFVGADLGAIAPERGSAVVIGVRAPAHSQRVWSIIASRPQARALRTSEREVAAVVLDLLLSHIAAHGLGVVDELARDPRDWAAA